MKDRHNSDASYDDIARALYRCAHRNDDSRFDFCLQCPYKKYGKCEDTLKEDASASIKELMSIASDAVSGLYDKIKSNIDESTGT